MCCDVPQQACIISMVALKKGNITLAVVAATRNRKKAERKIIRKIVDECTGSCMRDIVIDRFQEIGSRLCTSHLEMPPPRNKFRFSHRRLGLEREKETHP
jgi:hypothetical protein